MQLAEVPSKLGVAVPQTEAPEVSMFPNAVFT